MIKPVELLRLIRKTFLDREHLFIQHYGRSESIFPRVAGETINTVTQEIRAADAVVVMGAGVSFAAGMPLGGQLSPLVWHVLDSSPDVLNVFCARLGAEPESAKSIVGDDPVKINRALQDIKDNQPAFSRFKRSFCELDSSRAAISSAAHTALARLVHMRVVLEVISFNWDTLLERAFRQQFGFEINRQRTVLWKPHGDCADLDGEWVLPHEEGRIPPDLINHVTTLVNVRPRVLVIVGYAERDEAVVRKLIRPLANRWRVFRIGPTATGEGAVTLAATQALEVIADELAPTPHFPGWSSINFNGQRGLEGAIAGERLGPKDVEACPRLPHFDSAAQKLSLLHFVEIAGESGSGKSITVWQLAYALHQQGWQVLQLAVHSTNLTHSSRTLGAQKWKTVAVVDDSQTLPPEFLAEVHATACASIKVVFGTTDQTSERPNAIRAAAKIGVETLADAFRSRRAAVLSIVRQFDPHVGDGFLDTRLESRIDQASTENTPWLFAYVLRGGPRRARGLLDAAHDFEQADLLLLLIGARQVATLDAGSLVSDLIDDAEKLGRSESWVRASLCILKRQGAILLGDSVRCLHLRAAATIIELSLGIRKHQSYSDSVSAIQMMLTSPSISLRGTSWLLACIWPPHYEAIVSPDILNSFITRCYEVKTRFEIRDACYVLEKLLGRRNPSVSTHLLKIKELLAGWILMADLTDAYAVGCVINNLHNESHALAEGLMDSVDPKQVAEKIATASLTDGRVWGHYASRLCVAGGSTWRRAVALHLPRDVIRQKIEPLRTDDCGELPDYIQGLAGFDFDFALELLERATPAFAGAIGTQSLNIYRVLHDLPHWLLGEGLFMDAKPTRRQRAISKRILDGLDPSEVVRGIVTCRFGDWEYYARLLAWVSRAHPSKKRAIVDAMDWVALDQAVCDRLEKPGRELALLLTRLVTDHESGEPVANWLFRHANRIQELSPLLAAISPQTAVAILKRGATVNLSLHHGWQLCVTAIARIWSLDPNASKQVVEQNIAFISKGVTELSLCEGLSQLLEIVGEYPGLLDQIFDKINLDAAKERWPRALADHRPKERKSARAALKIISDRAKAEVRDLADQTLQRGRRAAGT